MTPRIWWVAIALVGAVPAAVIGYQLGSPEPEITPQVETVVETKPAQQDFELPQLHRGPRPPGVWSWSELRGGECIQPYLSAWENDYSVVPCDTPHQAEFVRAIVADRDPHAPYPGDETLAARAAEHCESWERDQLNQPESIDDLIVEGAFSAGEAPWARGDRVIGCFVSQIDRGLFTSPLVN